jgi:hypothetical protein
LTTGPSYLGWRGELLAELALARIPGLTVVKQSDRPTSELPFSFLAVTEHGFCFFVEVRAFSSMRLPVADVDTVREWRWPLDADLVRRARESPNPVLLFLFDADTDHGRYLRLDTLPAPDPKSNRLTMRFSVEQSINKENLEELIAVLQGDTKKDLEPTADSGGAA